MRKLTRALSFILALALAVSLLGVTAFADDGEEVIPGLEFIPESYIEDSYVDGEYYYRFDDGWCYWYFKASPNEGNGYIWNPEDKTLTLSGVSVGYLRDSYDQIYPNGEALEHFSLFLPDDSTIILKDGSVNTFIGGIYCEGDLTITGNGTLNCDVYERIWDGIFCEGSLTISGINYIGTTLFCENENDISIENSTLVIKCYNGITPIYTADGSIDIKNSSIEATNIPREDASVHGTFNYFCHVGENGTFNLNGLDSTNISTEVVEGRVAIIDTDMPVIISIPEDSWEEETTEPDAEEVFQKKVSLLLIGFFG